MNSDELATLLAQTHGGPTPHSTDSDKPAHRVPRSPTTTTATLRSPASPLSPLSPRQLFQSRIRTLSEDGRDETLHQPGPPRSPGGKTRELQHLSSLRVHVRSTTPNRLDRHRRKKHGNPSRDSRSSFTPADPDFVVEERAAWNADSLDETRPVSSLSDAAEDDEDAHTPRPADPALSFPPSLSQNNPPLTRFGPSSNPNASHDRPRTSRGPRQAIENVPGTFPETTSPQNVGAALRSKFNEGSMNDRSTAVSSTWDDYGPRLSESSRDPSFEDTDSDATPRAASRISRDSNSSLDVSEFRPRPSTPSTIQNTISRIGSHFRSTSTSDETERTVIDQKKDKRRGLRKSISNWNFHTLGEKMKFFGNSTHDLGENPIKKQNDADMHLLSDRKRKAEVAYVQQFGTKKQKANDGIPVDDRRAATSTQPRTLKKRSTSAHRPPTPSTVRCRREASAAGARQPVDSAEILSDGDTDRRKRPTRRELEKENQQLRAMLRESQEQRSATMVRSASKSTVYLSLQGESALLPQPSNSAAVAPRQATAGATGKKQQKQHHNQGAPPVPALPSRAVLANLGTGNVASGRNVGAGCSAQSSQHASHFGAAETGTIKRVGGGVPRSVSTVIESEENMQAGENVLDLEFGMLPGLRPPACKESWQWPDDVF